MRNLRPVCPLHSVRWSPQPHVATSTNNRNPMEPCIDSNEQTAQPASGKILKLIFLQEGVHDDECECKILAPTTHTHTKISTTTPTKTTNRNVQIKSIHRASYTFLFGQLSLPIFAVARHQAQHSYFAFSNASWSEVNQPIHFHLPTRPESYCVARCNREFN